MSKITRFDYDARDYRRFTVYEEGLNYSYSFRLRKEAPETFESKWVLLRFNRWLIISVSWFQPDKYVKKRKKKTRTFNRLMILGEAVASTSKTERTLLRLTTLSKRLNPKTLVAKPDYLF